MTLLYAKVDDSTIHMMGQWKSWAMLQYLHHSATDTMSFAQCMIASGTYIIEHHTTLPTDVNPLAPVNLL